MADRLCPLFIDGTAGRLFAIYLAPAPEAPRRGAVLYLPPFAEEMNRSRRMVLLQARRMVELGYQVLIVDLYGTGDSEGDFADARWAIWRADYLNCGYPVVLDNNINGALRRRTRPIDHDRPA